jgi:hypothetical protein
MAEKQNLTVSLDKDIVRKAKVLAAQRGTSISQMVSVTIQQLVADDEAYEAARQRALARLAAPFHLGGSLPCRRDEWHER